MRLGKQFLGVISGLAMISSSVWADEPRGARSVGVPTAQAANQQVANDIATVIAATIPEGGYTVDLEFHGGVATLRGSVSSQSQMKQVLDAVRSNKLVGRVANEMKIGGDSVKPAGYQDTPQAQPMPGMAGAAASGQALAPASPEFRFPSGATPQYDMPFMPPFAWPARAPYPNYSAVQYPKKYPSKAWPYIGPFTPYPEAPMDWREVKMYTLAGLNPLSVFQADKQPPAEWQCVSLKWDSGHWYLRFHDNWWSPTWLTGGFPKGEPATNPECTSCVDMGGYHVMFKQPFFTHMDVH